jgi:hypothetical protein
MISKEASEATGVLTSLFTPRSLTLGALALGGASLLLGGLLYVQFENEKSTQESLRKDIYPLEEVISYLEEHLYQSYPILLKLVKIIPGFRKELQ